MQLPGSVPLAVAVLALTAISAGARPFILSPASPACAPLPAGAIGWWPGNGIPNNSLGGLATVPYGGLTYQAGAVGSSMAFDGTTAWLELPFTAAINFEPSAAFTIESWVRADGVGGAETGYRAILVKCPLSGLWDWGLYVTPDNRFMAGCQSGHAVTSSTVALPGQWNHVAVTYDAGYWTLFVNGVVEATASGPSILMSDGSAALARKGVGPWFNDFFQGAIDECALYARALDSTEIAAIHSAGAAGKCEFATAAKASTWGALKTAYR